MAERSVLSVGSPRAPIVACCGSSARSDCLVLTACLPLMSAGVAAGGYVVAHHNKLFATIGARVLALGHGSRLFAGREADADAASVAAARSLLAASQTPECVADDQFPL